MAKANKKQKRREEVNAPPAGRPELTIEEVKALWDGIDVRQKLIDVDKWKLAKALYDLNASGVGTHMLAVKLGRSKDHVRRHVRTWRMHKDRPGMEQTSYMDAYYAANPSVDVDLEKKNRTRRGLQTATDTDLRQIIGALSPSGRARLKKALSEVVPDDDIHEDDKGAQVRGFDNVVDIESRRKQDGAGGPERTEEQERAIAAFGEIANDPDDPPAPPPSTPEPEPEPTFYMKDALRVEDYGDAVEDEDDELTDEEQFALWQQAEAERLAKLGVSDDKIAENTFQQTNDIEGNKEVQEARQEPVDESESHIIKFSRATCFTTPPDRQVDDIIHSLKYIFIRDMFKLGTADRARLRTALKKAIKKIDNYDKE